MEEAAESVLKHETLVEMLIPVLKCGYGYISENTGTPWEVNQQHNYLVSNSKFFSHHEQFASCCLCFCIIACNS